METDKMNLSERLWLAFCTIDGIFGFCSRLWRRTVRFVVPLFVEPHQFARHLCDEKGRPLGLISQKGRAILYGDDWRKLNDMGLIA